MSDVLSSWNVAAGVALKREDVFLLPVELRDREAIGRELRRFLEPALHRGLRDLQQLGREPCRGSAESGKHGAYTLELAGDVLVAGIDVALQLGIPVDPVAEHADVVEGPVGGKDGVRTARQRPLARNESVHFRLNVLHARFPRVPAGVDRREVPAVFGRYFLSIARCRRGRQARR
jgi:hypothetical protein